MPSRSFHLFCRSSLAAGVGLALALAFPAQAEEKCSTPDGYGVSRCEAGLSAQSVQQMAVTQEQSQWCWAASISMIFAHHGYRVAQQEIVRDGYGTVVDRPAPSGQAMTHALSRSWTDEDDKPFQARALASDALARQYQVSNDKVISELAAGRPLLLGALAHAVVLVNLSYERMDGGTIRITGGTVIDPEPGLGIRPLLRGEMRPSYVAAVQVLPGGQNLALLETAAAN